MNSVVILAGRVLNPVVTQPAESDNVPSAQARARAECCGDRGILPAESNSVPSAQADVSGGDPANLYF